MSLIALFTTINSFLSSLKILKNPLLWIAVSLLLSVFLWRSCSNGFDLKKRLSKVNQSTMLHEIDPANELKIELSIKDYKIHMQEGRISSLLDSLKIKPKQIISYKYIKTDRVVHDTLYDINFSHDYDLRRKYDFKEKCFTATVDLTGANPVIKATINNELLDINYSERRRLFGWTFTPKLGRKEFRQTIISPCGDTIKNNELVSFKKPND